MRPKIVLVVAVAKNGVIGLDGKLPWRLSSDLRNFKTITMGKPLIMGRKTWESLPKRHIGGAGRSRGTCRLHVFRLRQKHGADTVPAPRDIAAPPAHR